MIQNYGETYLIHHGILGQKWGIRRYQNSNGTLTSEGRARLKDYKKQQINRLDEYYRGRGTNGFLKSKSGMDALTVDRDYYKSKLSTAKAKGKSEKKIEKLKNRIKTYDKALNISKMMKDIENRSIKDLDYNKMLLEKQNIGKERTKDILITFGSMAAAVATANVTGFGMYTIRSHSTNSINTSYRINNYATEKEKKKFEELDYGTKKLMKYYYR